MSISVGNDKSLKHKIIVSNNKIEEYHDSKIEISGKRIKFISNGDYTLEYVNSNDINLDIEILDGVCVKLFIISGDNDLLVRNHYRLGENSNLLLFKFYYNKSIDEEVIFDLNGDKAMVSYNFSSITFNNEEYHIIVNHNENKVSSKISNRCVGLDGSKISLVIDSNLDKGNIDCVMEQNSRILTLGDVNASIVPNMYIDEDSVEARHGSVIGRIRPEEIFYLMSRGITEEEAVTLIVKGLIFSNLIVDMERRARIFQMLQELKI